MSQFVCTLFFLTLLASPLRTVLSQSNDVVPLPDEPYFEIVPGGTRLIYGWRDSKSGREVSCIDYAGPAEWLVSQKHPRSHWHKFPSLESIRIGGTDLTPEEVSYIASLKSVRDLDLSGDGLVFLGGTLAPLEKMTWLTALRLNFNSHLDLLERTTSTDKQYPRGDFFRFLEKLQELESIDIWPHCDESTFVRICGLKKLKHLMLGDIGEFSDQNAELLSHLSQLEFARFGVLKKPTPFLRGLRAHPQLESLHFRANVLSAADVELISSVTRIRELSVFGKQIGSLSAIQSLVNLQDLRLHFDEVDKSNGCRFLADLPKLESLMLQGVASTDFTLEHLRGHKNLKELGVSAVLSKADIDVLASLPALKSLYVGNVHHSPWHLASKHRLPGVKIFASGRE